MRGKAIQVVALAITVSIFVNTHVSAQTNSIYDATLAETGLKTKEVSTNELRSILADKSAIVIDSRSRAEYEAGHIPGAQNLDVGTSEQIAAVQRIVDGDKSKPVVLYCNGPFCRASKRLGEKLAGAGFTNVRRYQLGIPIWRALGGPTEIEIGGIQRIYKADSTAVFVDVRSSEEFNKGSVNNALNLPAEDIVSGKLKKLSLPEDDFNRRIVLFGSNTEQARKLAEFLSRKPWHNVMYYAGPIETIVIGLKEK